MRRLPSPLPSVCVSFLVAVTTGFQVSGVTSSVAVDSQRIDAYVTARMRSARIPGLALAVVRGDAIIYLKGYGRADPSGRAVTPQTPFLIGSVTKPLTALAVMQLVDAGKVDLDAPVQRYLPWFRVADPLATTQITVRQLLSQTSGIPQNATLETWTWPNDDDAMERHVRLLANVKLIARPGQSFAYANVNYVTLGVMVAAVSGESYEDYMQRHIFAPLDMHNSYLSQDEAMQHGMAMGHRWWFGFPVAVTLPFNRANLAGGFAISSAEDMAHFVIAHMNGGRYLDRAVLSRHGIETMRVEPAPNTYALGWEAVHVNGRTLINHDGGTANSQSSLFFDPDARVGVFAVANAESALDAFSSPHGSSPLDGPTLRAVAQSVLALVTGQPLPPQGPGLRRLTVIFDLMTLLLTVVLAIALARIRRRFRRLAQRGITRLPDLLWRSGLATVLHFAWPLILLYVALSMSFWILLVQYQPDLVYWLTGVAIVVGLKGLLELALLWQVYRRSRQRRNEPATVAV